MGVELDAFARHAYGVGGLIVIEIGGEGGFEGLKTRAWRRNVELGQAFPEVPKGLPVFRNRRKMFEHPERASVGILANEGV